jgi:hypothetical protein
MITISMLNSKISGYGRNEEEAHLNAYKNFFESVIDDEDLYSSLITAINKMKESLSGERNNAKSKKPPKGKNDTAYLSQSILNVSTDKALIGQAEKNSNKGIGNSGLNFSMSQINESTMGDEKLQNTTQETIGDLAGERVLGKSLLDVNFREGMLLHGGQGAPNGHKEHKKNSKSVTINVNTHEENNYLRDLASDSKNSQNLSQKKNLMGNGKSPYGSEPKKVFSPNKENFGSINLKNRFSQTQNNSSKSTAEIPNSNPNQKSTNFENKFRQRYIRERLSTNPSLPTNQLNKSYNTLDGCDQPQTNNSSSLQPQHRKSSAKEPYIEDDHDCIYRTKYRRYKEENYKMSILVEQLQKKLKKYQEEVKSLNGKLLKKDLVISQMETGKS